MLFLWGLFWLFTVLTLINGARYLANRFAHRSTRLTRIYSGYAILGVIILGLVIAVVH